MPVEQYRSHLSRHIHEYMRLKYKRIKVDCTGTKYAFDANKTCLSGKTLIIQYVPPHPFSHSTINNTIDALWTAQITQSHSQISTVEYAYLPAPLQHMLIKFSAYAWATAQSILTLWLIIQAIEDASRSAILASMLIYQEYVWQQPAVLVLMWPITEMIVQVFV